MKYALAIIQLLSVSGYFSAQQFPCIHMAALDAFGSLNNRKVRGYVDVWISFAPDLFRTGIKADNERMTAKLRHTSSIRLLR